jgi:hypothetical protein
MAKKMGDWEVIRTYTDTRSWEEVKPDIFWAKSRVVVTARARRSSVISTANDLFHKVIVC